MQKLIITPQDVSVGYKLCDFMVYHVALEAQL